MGWWGWEGECGWLVCVAGNIRTGISMVGVRALNFVGEIRTCIRVVGVRAQNLVGEIILFRSVMFLKENSRVHTSHPQGRRC